MSGADAVLLGFADHFVPSDRLDALREALAYRADPTGPAEIVLLFDETPEASAFGGGRGSRDDRRSGRKPGTDRTRCHARRRQGGASTPEPACRSRGRVP